MDNVKEFKAPWDLNGSGYIFIYKFKKRYNDDKFCVQDFLKNKYCGGFGSVMLVDYKYSTAGPYQEFLIIPGKYKFKDKKLNTISKIYVSTLESVYNGKENWGIPKELADFKFESIDKNIEEIIISINNEIVAKFTIKSRKLRFPVNTKLMPFPLVQEFKNKYYYTNFFGKGKGRFAKIKKAYVNEKYFPCFTSFKKVVAIKVDPFSITFPESIIENK